MGEQLESILLVEDEQDIRVIARMALEKVGGFTVEIRKSGREAVERARDFAPDLILLDVMMPGMDGPATLEALRANAATSDIPVIFISARVQPREVSEYLSLGVIGVIPKPFDPMTLADEVRTLWASSRAAD